jgi:ribosomal protein L25 (general stress protein Ctc)
MAKTVKPAHTVNALGESQAAQSPAELPQALQQTPAQLKKRSLKKEEQEEELQDAAGTEGVAAAADDVVVLAQASGAAAPAALDGGVVLAQAAPAAAVPAASSAAVAAGLTAGQMLAIGGGALLVAGAAGGGGSDAPPPPRYSLTAEKANVNEGSVVIFTLTDRSKAVGEGIDYEISGVDAADVIGGKLTGRAVIDASGQAKIEVQLVADRATEGAETLTLTIAGQSQSVTVNDTSVNPTYTLTNSGDSVDEGQTAIFTLQTTDVDQGATFAYQITGVNAADVVGGQNSLTGVAVIGADGKAKIEVELVADRATEGAETLTLTVAGQSQSVTVNDTSVNPTYTLTKSGDSVDEGQTAVFTLQTTNVDQGATFAYQITGVNAADVVGGQNSLTGVAVIGADGKAKIEVELVADRATEGAETLTLTVAGQSQSVTVSDTSVDADINLTTAQDDFAGQNKGSAADNLYIGRVSDNDDNTTFTEGDQIDGGAGNNTLRRFMDPRTIADGVEVSNIQNLDLRLTEGVGGEGYTSRVVMTDWDASLQKIDIRSNKSSLEIREQKTLASVSIVDGSTAAQTSSYAFGYAAGVLDSASDHLRLAVDNVNGTGGSDVSIDEGMESVAINVADRSGDQ